MKKCLFAAALAVFALASCSKEDKGTNNGGTEGKVTVAEITVKHAATYTRSVSSAPTADEKTINDMTIYVFNNSNILENIVAFDAAEITAGAGTGTYTKQFSTTTGIHHFIVAANIPTASGVKPSPMPALGDVLADVEKKLVNIAQKSMDDLTKNVAAAHFFMTTNATASKDLIEEVSPSANKVNLELGRGMAKVTVNISNTVNEPNGVLDRTGTNKIEFFVAGNPVRMHYFPVYSGTQLMTPYYAYEFKVTKTLSTHTDANDYFPVIAAADTYATLTTANRWVDAPMNNDADATKPFVYAMENSNAVPAYGESTYAMITGLYIPKVWGKWDGSTIVDDTTLPTVPTTFYRLGIESASVSGTYTSYFTFDDNAGYEVSVFSNVNTMTAAEIATLTGTPSGTYKVVEYTGGRSFYGLWLADMSQSTSSARYCVERNDYFDIVINDINGPGSNTPIGVIPEPEKPIEKQTVIEATITIKPWNVVTQNGSIG